MYGKEGPSVTAEPGWQLSTAQPFAHRPHQRDGGENQGKKELKNYLLRQRGKKERAMVIIMCIQNKRCTVQLLTANTQPVPEQQLHPFPPSQFPPVL